MLAPRNGYSARVRLRLVVGSASFEVEQVSPSSCLLAHPIDHPPCDAELIVEVDGRERTRRVALPQGIERASNRVVFG